MRQSVSIAKRRVFTGKSSMKLVRQLLFWVAKPCGGVLLLLMLLLLWLWQFG